MSFNSSVWSFTDNFFLSIKILEFQGRKRWVEKNLLEGYRVAHRTGGNALLPGFAGQN